ncbi:preprotein translocase subunit TatA [Syntrophotalea acetylenivorans]|uniref:Sec-independent protein translocase protein TatA n=1 Tax=Syntrophotalea acetylenivorans TaxID=1842532 RepID=A0A1L3GRZ4_9BACT|nr:twin-arginine translocase TatA/TatE family subunit [Syntrophotalea acetylenivorans]APG28702.1 preprotein translocase subunit TatA [Syntrophotalea acetylenivorans]
MGIPGTFELILILAVVVLIFGGRKLPEIGSALGKGITNFRRSLQGKDEIDVTPKDKKDDEPKA